jgi:prevent-host-death family protein
MISLKNIFSGGIVMINLAQDLRPVSYVKAHTTEIVKYVGDSKAPVVITQNGEAKAVIIDIESYQKTINAIYLATLLRLSENEIKKGNTISHENAKKYLKKH